MFVHDDFQICALKKSWLVRTRFSIGFAAGFLLSALALGLFIPARTQAALPTQPIEQERIFGADRYSTAANLSRWQYSLPQSAQAAVLVRGDLPAEGLVAGPLASVLDGPILLTGPNMLPPAAEQELLRVLALGREVWILGGRAAVSDIVEQRVQQLGFSTRRLDGPSRISTADRVAQEVWQRAPGARAYLVNGWSGVDAFIASNVATAARVPILLSRPNFLDQELQTFLDNRLPLEITTLGGSAVLSPTLITELEKNHDVSQIFGANRFATNLAAIAPLPTMTLGFGNAARWPDLLVGGSVLGRAGIPLVLVRENLAAETQQFLRAKTFSISEQKIIGGSAVISDSLAKRLLYLKKNKRQAQDLLNTRLKSTAGSVPVGKFPFASTDLAGAWNFLVSGRDFVEGFWIAWLYKTGQQECDSNLMARARAEAQNLNALAIYPQHDRGFVYYFGHAQLCDAGEAQFCSAATAAADTLVSLFDPTLQTITTTPNSREAIIDSTMNTLLLYWAADYTGNLLYRTVADATNHTLANILIRGDGSTAQSVHFNSDGSVGFIHTHQGFADTSTWVRGQAWALYALTQAYRETGDTFYLNKVRALVDYLDVHLPRFGGLLPYDFDATDVGHADTSALAILADGLLEAASVEPDPTRAAAARATAEDLIDRCLRLALVPTLSLSGPAGRLLQQTYIYPDSLEFIVGDYFLFDALQKL